MSLNNFALMKQIMEQYFLSRSGKRAMTGNFYTGGNRLYFNTKASPYLYFRKIFNNRLGLQYNNDSNYASLVLDEILPVTGIAMPSWAQIRTQNVDHTRYYLSAWLDGEQKDCAMLKDGYMSIMRAGDVDCGEVSDSKGLILKDRTTAIKYRLKIDNGVLGMEAV